MDRPLVSVIIPTYNHARFVRNAVDSALAQTYAPVEIIVVDDGSADGTREVLAPYGDRIRYIHQSNRGLPAARNTGLRAAKGSLIALLDADDEWLPGKLTAQIPVLLGNPRAALIHSDIVSLDEETGARQRLPRGRERFRGRCRRELFLSNDIIPSTVVMRREAVETCGAFDETFTSGCEDRDLFLRLAREHEFAYYPDALVIYRLHATNMTRSPKLVEGRFAALQKNIDDDLLHEVGAEVVRAQMSELAAAAGYANAVAGDLRRARLYFRRAFAYHCTVKHLLLWLSTFLPLRWRRSLGREARRAARLLARSRS